MKTLVLLVLVVFVGFSVFSQNKKKDQDVEIITHSVQLGESVRLISKKYLVDPAEIYRLNKFAVEGVTQGMVLRIPVARKDDMTQQEQTNSAPVAEGTTINEPTTQIVIRTEDKAEPVLANAKTERPITVIDRTSSITHTVAAKETLFSLSKKYSVSVDEIKLSNPILSVGLKVGQVIKIPSTRTLAPEESSVGTSETPQVKSVSSQSQRNDNTSVTHVVAPKETLYSLSKKYNITIAELKQHNDVLSKQGLQVGQVLTIKKNN